MNFNQLSRHTLVWLAFPLLHAGAANALTVSYVAPLDAPNSQGSLPTNINYTSNLGYAFITGPSGPYDIDFVNVSLNTGSSTATSGSFKLALHGMDNNTPYLAVPNATAFATDTVNFAMPGVVSSPLELNLTDAQIPNITSYSLLTNTAYSLFIYQGTTGVALRRTTGYANGTTNDKYTVTNGFIVIDTFRNQTPNYSNIAGSYPAFAISFGANSAPAATAPGPLPVLGAFAGFRASRKLRQHLKARRDSGCSAASD